LTVTGGNKLLLTKDIGRVVLDGNIELSETAGLDLSEDAEEVLEKFYGSGYVAVESTGTGSIYKGNIVYIGADENSVFVPSANSKIALSGAGITLINGEVMLAKTDGTYDLERRLIITAGARLIIPSGTSLRAPLKNKLEGTAANGNSKSKITVMNGAALMVYPGDDSYYPDIPATSLPINLEWDNAGGKWVMAP